jgi:hypothetical protein
MGMVYCRGCSKEIHDTGLLQLFTSGGLGIWAFIDFILVALGRFTDSDGREVTYR